jgi:membrane fusion protein (multidrug efflux system)
MLRAAFSFWKEFAKSPKKLEFLGKRAFDLALQFAVVAATCLVCFVVYNSMKPVVRGTCRIVLQTEDSLLDTMRGRIVGVEAHRSVLGSTQREVKSIGVLKANAEAVIKSEIPGKIAEILFTEGGEVEQGQDLIKFEDDYYRAEKEKSEAEYKLHKDEFERSRKLREQNVGSQKSYDEAYAKMMSAKAQLDIAAFQLSRTTIKAPFSGTIGIMKGAVTPGNIVQQQTEIVDLVDNSSVRVEFPVPAKHIEEIAVGQNVDITVDAFRERTFSGAVEAIDSEVDTRNHSILVRAVIPNRGGVLRHGLFANVKLITGEKSNVVLVDADTLDREGSVEFVWVIDDKGRARRQRVLSGSRGDNGVEIVDGLPAGTMVVTAGQLKLTDGITVNILNKDSEAPLSVKGMEPPEEGTTEQSKEDMEAAEKAATTERQTDEPGQARTDVKEPASRKGGLITSFFKKLFGGKAAEQSKEPKKRNSEAKTVNDEKEAPQEAPVTEVVKEAPQDEGHAQQAAEVTTPNAEQAGSKEAPAAEAAPAAAAAYSQNNSKATVGEDQVEASKGWSAITDFFQSGKKQKGKGTAA